MKALIEEKISGILPIEPQLADHKNGLTDPGVGRWEE